MHQDAVLADGVAMQVVDGQIIDGADPVTELDGLYAHPAAVF
jgi:hypothetical protein